MQFIGIFNRDGGTFRTTDLGAFTVRAIEIFAAAAAWTVPSRIAAIRADFVARIGGSFQRVRVGRLVL